MVKILIIGDDRFTKGELTAALASSSYEVLAASDGREALFRLGAAQPDLVILDILPPQRDAWDTLQRIRELSPVPIIALGAPGDQKTEIKSLECGADYYLAKPPGAQELCARVRALLRRTRARPMHA